MWLTGKMFAKHTQGPKFNSQHDKKEEEEIVEVVPVLLKNTKKQYKLHGVTGNSGSFSLSGLLSLLRPHH